MKDVRFVEFRAEWGGHECITIDSLYTCLGRCDCDMIPIEAAFL